MADHTRQIRRRLPWRDPLETAAALGDRDGLLALLSDGGALGRWSWIGCEPEQVEVATLDAVRGARPGTAALLSYDAGARVATGARETVWPDLILAHYPALLAFDHRNKEVFAVGLGHEADAAATRAARWLDASSRSGSRDAPASDWIAEASDDAYRVAVADVIDRIGQGEFFQANIARAWSGVLKPGRQPFEVMTRLANRRSAYGAYWRVGDRAIVSNSPEMFLTFDPLDGRIETRPIKGTRPRLSDPVQDAAAVRDLSISGKDRAENLMIVDLMRNDLARACEAGTVRVDRLFEVESHPTVHHLVSTVVGRVAAGVEVADILSATFPPGSITGAPKHQAMKVIAAHEPPRGPWCGSLAWIDPSGRLTASVLIRTASFERKDDVWRFRTLAGAGIVADSDPMLELAETDAKIRALREALTGRAG